MEQTYYIDGYNVNYHAESLRPLAMENFELAREALIEKVSRFCSATGSHAKIIFDGRGKGKETGVSKSAQGVEIMYSPGNITADTLIERIVYSSPDRRAMIVVSADRGIRNICGNLNALVMQPDNFLSAVGDTEKETRSAIKQMQKPDSQKRIEERLDSKSLDALRALKEKLSQTESDPAKKGKK